MKVIGFKDSAHNTQNLAAADLIVKDFKQLTPKILEKIF